MRLLNPRWTIPIVLNVLFGCVLCFNRPGHTQSKATTQEPFANATGQRAEMIAQLKELNAQLKEQNALLASGKLQVVVAAGKEKPGGGQ